MKHNKIPWGENRFKSPISIVHGTSPKVQKISTFGQLFEEIKINYERQKDHIKKLRFDKKNNPVEYKKNKENSKGFIIGEFSKRTDKDCKTYVPCLAFDIDGIDENLAHILLSDLKKIPFVFAAFLSPGAGLRILTWCDATPSTHKEYYQSFCSYLSSILGDFIKTDKEWKTQWLQEGLERKEIDLKLKSTPNIDTSVSNISRFWFYVPLPENEIYLNLDSIVYTLPTMEEKLKRPRIKKNDPPLKSTPTSIGIISEKEKVELCDFLAKERHKGGSRNGFVSILAHLLCEHGVSIDAAKKHCFSYAEPLHSIDPFKESEISKTVNSAYKRTSVKFNDEQILNYRKKRFGNNPNGTYKDNIKTTNKRTPTIQEVIPAVEKKEEKKESSSGKKSKFVQIEEYLFDKYEFRKNIISIDIEYRKKGSDSEFKDLNENDLMIELMRMGFTGIETSMITILKSSLVPEYDPFLAYKNSLPKWDESKPDYINQLANHVKAKDQYWFNFQFKKMLVRSAACALNKIPFNKQCFTILGKQNDGKSSFLRFICPPNLRRYFKEDLDFNNKDGRLALCTNFFINLDELASLSKYELNKIKNHFTLDQVKERLPYDRKPSVFPRRATFLASTNEEEFLTDSTGNVRWLVLEIDGINHDNGGKNGYSQNIDIDMVWAQVFYLLDSGFDFKLSVEEIKKSELNNKRHRLITAEFELIQKHFLAGSKANGDKFYRTSEVQEFLAFKYTSIKLNVNKIGKALKELGIERVQTTTGPNRQERGYFLKER